MYSDISFASQIIDILKSGKVSISTVKPSVWTEANVIMGKPYPGPYRYKVTPYWREVIDRFAQDDPMRWMAIMKGAQLGFSAGVLIPIILWMIKNDPSNCYYTVGSPDLVSKATTKLDIGINNAGMRDLIRPQVERKRKGKTGDTNTMKEYIGGYTHIGTLENHEAIRDVSLKYGLLDDWDAIKSASEDNGSTRKLFDQRFSAYAYDHKICYGSSPKLEDFSNIYEAYLLGDQRKYMIECPCCSEHIELVWSIKVKTETGERMAGITWKLDENKKVIPESVGYICQACGDFFDDKDKDHWLLEKDHGGTAYWKPTAIPSKPGFYSYHISCLYAPISMFDWEHYVNDFIDANPEGQPVIENLMKTFTNLALGLPYKTAHASPDSNRLLKNIRNYEIGSVPEKLSIADGNGKIVGLTLASDLNGKLDDARLDYEVVAWTETGSSYSVTQGSIGTFIPNQSVKEKEKVDRVKSTYRHGRPNSVWTAFDKIKDAEYFTDTGRKMKILITGVDVGQSYNDEDGRSQANAYIDKKNDPLVIGLKGKDNEKYLRYSVDTSTFKNSVEKPDKLYLVEVGKVKDNLSEKMGLYWDENQDEQQPSGFMNYPLPQKHLYQYKSFFEHYSSEHRIEVKSKDGNANSFRWEKKNSTSQNHFWDIRVYGLALKDIVTHIFCKAAGIKNPHWQDLVNMIHRKK